MDNNGNSKKIIPWTLSFVVTKDCNLSCSYCYENHKTNQSISPNYAISIISKYLSNRSYEYRECIIDLFGGEPFLQFDIIKDICEYIWSKKWCNAYIFNTTTNGTLIHDNIQEWLHINKDRISLTLSLDGTREMHNINRSNSFDNIDIGFFKSHWNNPVKMTISQETLGQLSEGVIFLHALGLKIHNNFAFGIDWSNNNNVEILSNELRVLVNYYLHNKDISPCSLLDMSIESLNNEEKKWCGTGTNMITYDVDGTSYPCHAFLPLSIGEENAIHSKNIDFNDISILKDEKCTDCLLRSICPTCYGINLQSNGDIKIRDTNLCKLTKVRALACSYLKANQLKLNNHLQYNNNLIKGILDIQKKIDI